MKTIIETKSGLYFDLDELAAISVEKACVYIRLKGVTLPIFVGQFDDEKSAQIYRDLIIKEWCGDEDD